MLCPAAITKSPGPRPTATLCLAATHWDRDPPPHCDKLQLGNDSAAMLFKCTFTLLLFLQ